MATLKGQNFRIIQYIGPEWNVIAMSTSCTVTLTANTESSTHKDVVGNASRSSVVSKSWSVQVESLYVGDITYFINAAKNGTKFKLAWDETDVSDNQSPENADFSRTGEAYLTDFTVSFNDRENSVKQLQFTGSGPLSTEGLSTVAVDIDAFTKGQFVRLFLGSDNTATPSKVIAAAKQLSLHIAMSLESATTKDTATDYVVNEPTELSYDISTNALVRSNDVISSAVLGQKLPDLETIFESGTPVKWEIANVSGANNRTKGTRIVGGSVIVTQLTINAPDRTIVDYTAQLTGYGALT